MKLESISEAQTEQIASKLNEFFVGTDVLGLVGGLGAGKTAFVRGLASGFGSSETVSSPTYVLEHIYPCSSKNGISNLVHWDLYRLAGDSAPQELYELGSSVEDLVVVEWPEKVEGLDPLINYLLEIRVPEMDSDRRELVWRRLPQDKRVELKRLGWRDTE